jgi:hypothetical protein
MAPGRAACRAGMPTIPGGAGALPVPRRAGHLLPHPRHAPALDHGAEASPRAASGLINDHAIDLYDRVPVGTRVVVREARCARPPDRLGGAAEFSNRAAPCTSSPFRPSRRAWRAGADAAKPPVAGGPPEAVRLYIPRAIAVFPTGTERFLTYPAAWNPTHGRGSGARDQGPLCGRRTARPRCPSSFL